MVNEVLVAGGSFDMGNTRGDKAGWEIEYPIHRVSLNYDFFVGETPVTFSEYDEYCHAAGITSPSDFSPKTGYPFGRGSKPVLDVTWWEAIAYCNWLSMKNHLPVSYVLNGNSLAGSFLDENGEVTADITKVSGYRLLTEAEWEYAARGGASEKNDFSYSGSRKLNDVGWFWKNSGENDIHLKDSKWPLHLMENKPMPHEVKKKQPNALGLYDMSGNVWEWCHDWFKEYVAETAENSTGPETGEQRVIRGGGWFFSSHTCRVSSRFYFSPNCSDFNTGFRIAKIAV